MILRAIIEGRAPNVVLAPRDVVFVPGRTAVNPRKIFDRGAEVFSGALGGSYGARIYREMNN